MTNQKYDALKLENQLCFPLYVTAKEIVKKYTPLLAPYELTYTQYITLLVMWEHERLSVKQLGEYLYLDSGTLTPLLKKIEHKGYIKRHRNIKDERIMEIELTPLGRQLKDKLIHIPNNVACSVHLTHEEIIELYRLLYKLLGTIND